MAGLGWKIAKIAREGALDAATEYFDMSVEGNLWNQGIEPYVSVKIGERIFGSTEMRVELEYPYTKILDQLKINGADKKSHHALSLKSKFDVTVFRKKNRKPIGVIEVKKRFAEFKIAKDRDRVLDAVKYCNAENKGVRFGILIAVEAIRENQQKCPEVKVADAINELNKDVETYRAEIEYNEVIQDLGFTSGGTKIIGARAFSILIRDA